MFVLKAILLAMLMVALLSVAGGRNAAATSLDLAQFQWKNRLLFLFSPARSHPFFDGLHRALVARQAEVTDRDLVIFEILEFEPSNMDAADLEPQTAQFLREKFKVSQGQFTVILIGKDGGIKLDRQNETRLEDIFSLIDSMPMRRQEMRQKTQ